MIEASARMPPLLALVVAAQPWTHAPGVGLVQDGTRQLVSRTTTAR